MSEEFSIRFNQPDTYICEYCGKGFRLKVSFDNHKRECIGGKYGDNETKQ